MFALQKVLRGLVLGTVLAALVGRAEPQKAEFRAFWADAWHEGFQSPAEVSKLISEVRMANCNAVLLQVRKRGDAYYRGSRFEPVARLIEPGFDPLAEVIQKAHDTNSGPRIEVHAWFVTYPVTTVRVDKTNTVIMAKAEPKHPYNLHPDWLDESAAGVTSDGSQYAFDPGHPQVQQYLFRVAMDIISRYDIDGFHLDQVRYSSANRGYNKVAVERFNARFNRSGRPAPDDPDWAQFRRDQVTALVRKIYLSAIALKPSLKISASLVTWAPSFTQEARWTQSTPYKVALQDWRAWMEEGILDMGIPMAFYAQANPLQARAYADWSEFAKDHKYNRHIAIGQAAYVNPLFGTATQVQLARATTAKGNKAEGFALYSYALPARGQSERSGFILTVRSRAGGQGASEALFEKPVPTPEMRWKTQPVKGHLKGFVFGQSNTNALDGAALSLEGPQNRVLLSDATGFYGAVDLPVGDYTLVTLFSGHASATNTITVTAGKVTTQDVLLENTGTTSVP